MAKFTMKGSAWSTLFNQHGDMVVLPEELTKKWWDKKKQVIAKATRATGIGETLDELAVEFRKVTWLNLPGNPTAIEKGVEDCKAFMTSGPLKAFRNKLKETRDLAKSEAKELNKNLLTRKTGAVLEEMADVAELLFVATNPGSLSTALDTALKAWGKEQRGNAIKNAGPTVNAASKVARKIPEEMKKIEALLFTFEEDDEAMVGAKGKEVQIRNALGNAIRDLCRDCTQPLGNLMKSHKAGVMFVDFDDVAIAQLGKDMSRISNTKGAEFMNGLSGPQANSLVKQVDRWTKSFIDLVGDVDIGVMPDL